MAAVDALPGRPGWYSTRTTTKIWDHGGFEHNHSLHDELVSAVHVIRPPKRAVSNARIDRPVSLVDIPPTVLALMGSEKAGRCDGVDLGPLWSGEAGDGLEKRLSSVRSNWVT